MANKTSERVMSLGRFPAVLPQISGKQIPSKVDQKNHANVREKIQEHRAVEVPEASATDATCGEVPRRSTNPVSNQSENCHRSSCTSNCENKYVYDSPQGSRFQNHLVNSYQTKINLSNVTPVVYVYKPVLNIIQNNNTANIFHDSDAFQGNWLNTPRNIKILKKLSNEKATREDDQPLHRDVATHYKTGNVVNLCEDAFSNEQSYSFTLPQTHNNRCHQWKKYRSMSEARDVNARNISKTNILNKSKDLTLNTCEGHHQINGQYVAALMNNKSENGRSLSNRDIESAIGENPPINISKEREELVAVLQKLRSLGIKPVEHDQIPSEHISYPLHLNILRNHGHYYSSKMKADNIIRKRHVRLPTLQKKDLEKRTDGVLSAEQQSSASSRIDLGPRKRDCLTKEERIEVDLQKLFSVNTTRKFDKKMKKMREERGKRMARNRNLSAFRERQNANTIQKVVASDDIYKIFGEDRREKTCKVNAAVKIQKVFRGWCVRCRFDRCRALIQRHSISLLQYVQKIYFPHLKRILQSLSVKNPKVKLNLDELAEYIEDRNRYEREFDLVAKQRVLLFSDVTMYVSLCGLSAPTEEVLTVLERLGHQQFEDIPKQVALEMTFYLRLPSAIRLDYRGPFVSYTTYLDS